MKFFFAALGLLAVANGQGLYQPPLVPPFSMLGQMFPSGMARSAMMNPLSNFKMYNSMMVKRVIFIFAINVDVM